jgi:hypothetical protein
MQSIPGGGDVRSEQPVLVIGENKVTEYAPRPRLQAINRQHLNIISRLPDIDTFLRQIEQDVSYYNRDHNSAKILFPSSPQEKYGRCPYLTPVKPEVQPQLFQS